MTDPGNQNCFVIAPIGKHASQTRPATDNLLDPVTHPVMKELRLKVDAD